MKKIAALAASLVAVAFVPYLDAADRPRRGEKRAEAKVVPLAPDFIPTIRYDTGLNAGFHPDAFGINNNRQVGNRFNSQLGAPLIMSARVTRMTVFPAHSGVQSFSLLTAPTSMNTAMVLDFLNANLMANAFNMVVVNPGVFTGPDFLGVFIGAYATYQAGGLLGMSDMQTMGQGYHAIQAFYAGMGLATMIEVVPNRNAMLRVTGDFKVPVELIDFKLE
jgi:hypothetical protein